MAKLGFVHTVHRVIPGIADLGRELCPEAEQRHFLDEATLQDAIAAGGLTPALKRRVAQLIMLAAEGADLVLVTCSSIGPAAELAAEMVAAPVLRIDRPMAEEAVQRGESIGVIATLATTLDPTADLVARCAAEQGRTVNVRRVLCAGAFAAGSAGDQETHDRLVREGLAELLDPAGPADVVVLAQASMARVTEAMGDTSVPILSSPRSGLRRAAEALRALIGEGD